MSNLVFDIGFTVTTIAILLLGAWLDCRAGRRVQAIKAYDVTPDAVRYVSTPREDRP